MPLIRKDTQPIASDAVAPDASLAALFGGDEDARWAATRQLAQAPNATDILGRALAMERASRVREAIFTSLARIATPASAEVVLPYLRSEDANIRTGALDALRAMPEAAGPHLPRLLKDEDPDVRLLITEIARGLPTAEAARLLCDLLEIETQPNVCGAAVEVLAEVGGPDALPTLQRCAARFHDQPFLGFSIRIAIERIGAPTSNA